MTDKISDQFDIKFNFVRFIKFLEKNNIAATAIAAVLSDRVNEVTNVFFDELILPIINRDANNDGVRDIKKFEEKEIVLFGAKFKLGKLILSVFKFLVVTYIIFILSKLLKRVSADVSM